MALSRQTNRNSPTNAAARPVSAREQTLAAVARVVECEIVPRLIAAHAARLRGETIAAHEVSLAAPAVETACRALDESFIADFAAELIAADQATAQSRIDRLRAGGMSPEAVCLQALAATARHLGDLWVKDLCSFIDVTNSTAMLHGFMNALRPHFTSPPIPLGTRRTAMLVTAPGEQHRFGLSMLAEFFRKEGWQVALPAANSVAQITKLGAARPIDVIGFSAGSERHLGALAACIAALRASACNPDLVVMVGGPIFLAEPNLVAAVGADGTAGDAQQAVQRAASLLAAKRAAALEQVSLRRARPTQAHQAPARTRVAAAACRIAASHAP